MTKAIILAAGKGSRIRKYHNEPKGLLRFAEKYCNNRETSQF